MDDSALFVHTAEQAGYPAAAAQATFARVRAQLVAANALRQRYFLYRTGGVADGLSASAGAAPPSSGRPRMLLAFGSADTALAFAQQQRLGKAPQLVSLSLGQILATLLNRPAIGAAIFVGEQDAPLSADGVPEGMRMSRTHLLDSLTETIF